MVLFLNKDGSSRITNFRDFLRALKCVSCTVNIICKDLYKVEKTGDVIKNDRNIVIGVFEKSVTAQDQGTRGTIMEGPPSILRWTLQPSAREDIFLFSVYGMLKNGP